MATILIGIVSFSLFTIFCFRHFFIQLLGVKLLLDGLILFLNNFRSPTGNALNAQTSAMLMAAISAMVFFVLMAAGIHRFARSKEGGLEVKVD